ncbi:hypothetical protein OAG68_01450 [bacterium]|nr:hypothetical protein [bacterium]
MKRFWKRFAIIGLSLVAFLALAAWVTLTWILTRPPNYDPSIDVGPVVLRSWPEHNAIYKQTTFPYVLSVDAAPGALEYIGAKHTSDATAPQLTEIEQRWAAFKPTVALCEGRSRAYRFASRPQSGQLSESDLTRILANRHGVPLYTLEPTYEAEVTSLLKHFEPKLVATYMTLRVYSAESSRSANTPKATQDALASTLLRKRVNVKGLRDTFTSIAELDAYWNSNFPEEPDWRTLPDTEHTPLLVEVGNVSRQVRGENMVRTLVELVNQGERVLAVVGASHVIRQEPMLKQVLQGEPANQD